MNDLQTRKAAQKFADEWKGKGYEKGQSQSFWTSLLRDVLGVEHPETFITFEEQVKIDTTNFIDGYIPATKVLIEQKSIEKDLRKAIRQSNGMYLTPFEQARNYVSGMSLSRHPRWIITCNFKEFLIYDMEKPGGGEPESILLKDLPKEYYRLKFIVDAGNEDIKKEMEISIKAGEIVGLLYDEILKQYINPEAEDTLKSLNALCVRLVFCLYAEDSGLFGEHLAFHNYLKSFNVRDVRRALIDLFKVLDTKPEDRDPYMDADLAAFPYVNGGLFADENIIIPQFNEKIVSLLLEKASEDFDWSEISPTIFGAVFESTLNPETRRSGGMHYTSIENIHKVINPLFLDDLTGELEAIKQIKIVRTRDAKLCEFQKKLGSLTFLDPACGSGNFLTETYISLRQLENEALKLRLGDQIIFSFDDVINVSIGQFYGIEVNDFAVTVAKTALWIAESQMMKKTEEIVSRNLNFLPLKSFANIVEGNALRIDWENVVPKSKLSYIMGNPPFVGYAYQSKEQKEDLENVVDDAGKNIDYVAGWYFKAAQYMQDTSVRTALVSTNSITQGEQVAAIWKPLYEKYNIHIDFAHRTFRWDSEASLKAHVHCVIVGFSSANSTNNKVIYADDRPLVVDNINAYLLNAPNIFIASNNKPISNVPEITKGSSPVDDGNFFFTDEEYKKFIKSEPKAQKYIKKFLGAKEFLHNIPRWCLWLQGASPAELRAMPLVMQRITAVKEFRLSSTKAATRKYADYPTRFMEIRQPATNYILIPRHTSENRKYIPFGFINPDIICGDANLMIPTATLYHFGVLTSNVHMAWMRAVCGRLEMRYRYSANIVYNNFPWPEPTEKQRTAIEKTAQEILDARALYPDSSLADLYDENIMPPELRLAHRHNDKAVMDAYGFNYRAAEGKTVDESQCVAELMKMYQKLTVK